ncbi:NAD(P)H-dependent oxidoreductase [Pontibacter sp. HSC-14F20]|uniref:NADPH-dependent FMN reductase n=1 Tax=Pontibacter sp. HSC-14F20 TaxID=2864136 RepID=UPI001C736112|nr:NADPH-dependent FMN reductase [Pontibacter sp. HSC-14F20]MBX0331842.1 NAD(P)H-dependent oxidoreductase [Pontibacter sp. HSC-14F20]
MPHITLISSSVRTGRKSHRVALYLQKYLEAHQLATTEIVDLKAYDFPLFHERYSRLEEPTAAMQDFREKIVKADGVVIVTPEYNGGYPASLKNVVDLLYDEWHRKPVAISTVSGGAFGGTQVITSLQFSLWKMRAWTVPAMFPVPKVQDNYDEEGDAADKEATDKRANHFLRELLWCVEAKKKMDESTDKP